MSNYERVEPILRELGVTFSQAKVYLALSKLGKPCSAKIASSSAQVARQDAYRIIAELQQLGLVEKVIGNPTRFKTIPIHEAFSVLLKNRQNKTVSLEEKVSQIVSEFSKNECNSVFEEDTDQFVLASEKAAFARMAKKAVESAQRSILVVTSWKECLQLLSMLSEAWNSAFTKGILIRWLTDQPSNEKSIQEISTALSKPNFSLGILARVPASRLFIYDQTELFIAFPQNPHNIQRPTFWTNNETIVSLMEEYFEMKWHQAARYQVHATH